MTYTPLDLVESFCRRFVIYPSEHALVAHVLWIAHTHLIDCWDTTPRIAFMSAEKESGKTLALEMTALFVPNPGLFLNASPAALVRLISQGHAEGNIPTILHDEIDNIFRGGTADPSNATLLAVFNQGYTPSATVPRCVGQGTKYQVEQMPCYCPIAFAGLKKLPDTLASRTIPIRMKRRANDEPKESYRRRRHVPEAEPIKKLLAEWCIERKESVPRAFDGEGPKMPLGIEGRTADCWEPLLAIADVAGGDWLKRAWDAAVYLTGTAADDTLTSGPAVSECGKSARDKAGTVSARVTVPLPSQEALRSLNLLNPLTADNPDHVASAVQPSILKDASWRFMKPETTQAERRRSASRARRFKNDHPSEGL